MKPIDQVYAASHTSLWLGSATVVMQRRRGLDRLAPDQPTDECYRMSQFTKEPTASRGLELGAVAAYIDEIASLKRQLHELQQTLADAQRLTKTGSWVIDPIGGGASCSPEGYAILGLPGKAASAHYMECLAHVHPDDLGEVLRGFGEAVQTGEPRPLHYRIVHPGGPTTDIRDHCPAGA